MGVTWSSKCLALVLALHIGERVNSLCLFDFIPQSDERSEARTPAFVCRLGGTYLIFLK